jgi:hypothetical protein
MSASDSSSLLLSHMLNGQEVDLIIMCGWCGECDDGYAARVLIFILSNSFAMSVTPVALGRGADADGGGRDGVDWK